MSAHSRFWILALPLLWLGPLESVRSEQELSLTVPEIFYAVEGVETGLVLRNFVLFEESVPHRFEVDCEVGILSGDEWTLLAKAGETGNHNMTVRLVDGEGKVLDQEDLTISIAAATAGLEESISLMILGDSLTNASRYPNTIGALLEEEGNPEWKMLGTYQPPSASPNVFHEGYGGWTWKRFNSQYAPEANQNGKTRTSPFLFPGEGPEPELNVDRYFKEFHGGATPDFITILLGINDCFHPDPNDPAAIETRIDEMMEQAEILLVQIQAAAPNAKIGIGLTPAPNARDGAFVENYKTRYTRAGWRRIQYRLVQRQLQDFGGREADGIYVVSTSHSVHPVYGYPEDNAVHPNDNGYHEIGVNFYSWIKAMLEK